MNINRFYPYLLSGLIIILMVLSFLIGREEGRAQKSTSPIIFSCSPDVLSALQIPPQSAPVEQKTASIPSTPTVLSETATGPDGQYFGSKNGTKYYSVGCKAGDRIKPENRVWFSGPEDAKIQGYTPANC